MTTFCVSLSGRRTKSTLWLPFDTARKPTKNPNISIVFASVCFDEIPPPLFLPTSFDANGDGRIDLLNFLNFFLTRDRKERRRAARVTRALEAMREDALHKQVDKIKKQTIGHVDRCVRALHVDCRGERLTISTVPCPL